MCTRHYAVYSGMQVMKFSRHSEDNVSRWSVQQQCETDVRAELFLHTDASKQNSHRKHKLYKSNKGNKTDMATSYILPK